MGSDVRVIVHRSTFVWMLIASTVAGMSVGFALGVFLVVTGR